MRFALPLRTPGRCEAYLAAVSGLTCGDCLGILFGRKFQRGALLDLQSLDRDIRDLESRELRNLDGIEFGGIEPFCYSLESAVQGSANGSFLRQSHGASGAAVLQPHEMPAGAADHRVESERGNIFHNGPLRSDGLAAGMDAIRENATTAQEYRMQVHCCTHLDAADACVLKIFIIELSLPGAMPAAEWSPTKSLEKMEEPSSAVPGPAALKLGAVGGVSEAQR